VAINANLLNVARDTIKELAQLGAIQDVTDALGIGRVLI
jgi:hypothetical protein